MSHPTHPFCVQNYEDYRKRMFSNPAGTQPSVRQAGPDPDAHGADSGAKNTPKPLFWPVPGKCLDRVPIQGAQWGGAMA